MRLRPYAVALSVLSLAAVGALPTDSQAARSRDDFKHFRVLSLDLLGRMPTRDEVGKFEKGEIALESFVDEALQGPGYVDRMTRIYADLLRLEPGPAVQFAPDAATLFRKAVIGPGGREIFVYFRKNQRRDREATDGEFCLRGGDAEGAEAEALLKAEGAPKARSPGVRAPAAAVRSAEPGSKPGPAMAKNAAAVEPKPSAADGAKSAAEAAGKARQAMTAMSPAAEPSLRVTAKALAAYTTLVRPWWLYRDYASSSPSQLYGRSWPGVDAAFKPVEALLSEPDRSPTTEIRICKEEAQTAARGHLYVSGRPRPAPGAPPPPGRTTRPPADSGYALAHAGQEVACDNKLAFGSSVDCGCGPGLERCVPNENDRNLGNAFFLPFRAPLGLDLPLDETRQSVGKWYPQWWAEEVTHFMRDIFAADRDFRTVLTSRATFVNGPLAQFYRSVSPANCCGRETGFGMVEDAEPLFSPSAVPNDLRPYDTDHWERVDDRGPHAAGLLTMPMFLEKFASRRARGATLYTAFLCKSFVADAVSLPPSNEPDLRVRPGCATCHATLEPLASYFARVEETNWVFLPPANFPVRNATCKKNAQGKIAPQCDPFYDPAFADARAGVLRGAYASAPHAEVGPAGAGDAISHSPEFASCAVERVTSSFLGRAVTADDAALIASLEQTFVAGGYRMRPLVRALVRSAVYRSANNLGSSAWRKGLP